VVDRDGGGRRLVATSPAKPQDFPLAPVWSPDGRMILFHRGSTLWIVDADGSNPRRVATNVGGSADWQPLP
jgi:Tol biopolymer transport system component